ncbi:MAG: DUF4276 family protein [Planctomycetes bacterium]|nr:DUF4276 family protein [Planctomycetota bacterium]
MRELVFFLEERSAAAILDGLLPKLIPGDVVPRYITFEGKQDLESQLVRRLRGYRNPNALFVVLRDQDGHPRCGVVKQRLEKLCNQAGHRGVLIRIACKELESFYLADLKAVEQALGIAGIAGQQAARKFRDPDRLSSAKDELRKLTNQTYQPVEGSRAIGPCLDAENARSRSFRNLVTGLRRLVGVEAEKSNDSNRR